MGLRACKLAANVAERLVFAGALGGIDLIDVTVRGANVKGGHT